MFVRASRRSLPSDPLKHSTSNLEILHLPFLCPALFARQRLIRNTSTTSKPWTTGEFKQPRAKGRQTIANAPQHSRRLASAAAAEYDTRSDYDAVWDSAPYSSPNLPPSFKKQSKADLATFDPNTSPIIINDTLSTYPKKFRSLDAISGDLNEIHQTLHACLQVGRLERAASLVRRLNQIYKADAPGLQTAHFDYVKELTQRIVRTGDQQLLQALQQWFEVDLCGAGVVPTAATYALMIQASLKIPGSKKARTIRRYLGLAESAGLREETLEYLSALELTAVAEANLKSQTIPSSSLPEIDQPSPLVANQEPGAADIMSSLTARTIPEVREAPQKGYGLMALKKSLVLLPNSPDIHSPSHSLNGTTITNEERQRFLERNTLEVAMERWHAEHADLKRVGVNSGLGDPTIGGMMWQWHEKMIVIIQEEIRKSHEAEGKESRSPSDLDRLLWAPYLQSLPPTKMSAVAILTAMKCCSTDTGDERGLRLQHVVLSIGDAVHNEVVTDRMRSNKSPSTRRDSGNMAKSGRTRKSGVQLAKMANSPQSEYLEWSKATRIRLGAVLLSHLMEIAKVQVSREDPVTKETVSEAQPVFFHTYLYVLGKRVGVVRLNTVVVERLGRCPVASAIAKYLPMLAEPRPWVGYREGGFLEHPVPVVRIDYADAHSRQYAMTASRNGDMSQIFAGLDVLGKTPWKINRFVFDVMLKVWNSGEAFAKIPPEDPPNGFTEPPPPQNDPVGRAIWSRKQRYYNNYRSGLKSQRCFQNFQMEVARAFLNETFYFPHNIDFRGRAYPLAPFMNHMGSDNCRGLLIFAKGKELTTEGLWWLKVHIANVYGYDKASFSERLQFTEDHVAEIRDSANDPLSGSRWWFNAEDPWQCLAACNELKNALDSPDPTRYVCQLPIHQDGTCNGLQHYAALGGDIVGARQVNLEPGQRPSDVYTGVAEEVKRKIAQDAAQGHKLAQALEGKISRKIVKQTVMTNVYGVTFVGARRQVQKQLEDLYPESLDLQGLNRQLASAYIAREIFAALSSMFKGAHDIQYWLTDCAGRISESIAPAQAERLANLVKGDDQGSSYKIKNLKGTPKNEIAAFKSTVVWTTPLKMPVVQPYRRERIHRISTKLQIINILMKSPASPVHKAKQVQAFPPNFIHSLDATHMFLTALKCDEVGLSFAAIHDSFWTHAGDVDTMNAIIRDAFIRMHSDDIIARLAAEFKARYKDFMHLASVPSGSAVARKIQAWRRTEYHSKTGKPNETFRSKKLDSRKWDEMLLERRRVSLLASEDPEEREQGGKMTTPGSIFEEAASEELIAPTDVKITPIGGTSPSTEDSSKRGGNGKANQQINVGGIEIAEVADSATANEDIDAISSKADPAMLDDAEAAAVDDDAEDDASVDAEIQAEEEDESNPDADDGELRSGADQTQAIPGGFIKKAPATRKRRATVWLWLPLTFRPVPKKGEFDVTRLKNSQYFFS